MRFLGEKRRKIFFCWYKCNGMSWLSGIIVSRPSHPGLRKRHESWVHPANLAARSGFYSGAAVGSFVGVVGGGAARVGFDGDGLGVGFAVDGEANGVVAGLESDGAAFAARGAGRSGRGSSGGWGAGVSGRGWWWAAASKSWRRCDVESDAVHASFG